TTIAQTPAPFVSVVYAMAVNGSELYVGGIFLQINGVSANNVAKWDGSVWSPIGSGIIGGAVFSMFGNGNDIYFGGNFTSAGGVTNTARLAVWNQFTNWRSIGVGFGVCDVFAITVNLGYEVYAAGQNAANGGCVWKWNDSAWIQIASPDSRVTAVATNGTDLYVGGFFSSIGGIPGTTRIAKWNGSSWSSVGGGVTGGGQVASIVISGSDVYAAGQFFSMGGNPADNVAKWNGSSWSALGSGFNNNLLALAIS